MHYGGLKPGTSGYTAGPTQIKSKKSGPKCCDIRFWVFKTISWVFLASLGDIFKHWLGWWNPNIEDYRKKYNFFSGKSRETVVDKNCTTVTMALLVRTTTRVLAAFGAACSCCSSWPRRRRSSRRGSSTST